MGRVVAGETFSVIMPVWNRSYLVGRAVASVVAQTDREWELVIVDDGSTDALGAALAPYLSEQVRLVRRPHAGVSAARNFGLQHSSGSLIAYLDSDNAWHPDYLARMRAAFNDPPAASAAYCRYRTFRRDRGGAIAATGVGGRPFSFTEILDEPYIDLNTFVHRRDCLALTGTHDETLQRMEDWDFILRVVTRYEPRYVPDVLVDYYLRCYDDSITCREPARPAARQIRRRSLAYDGPIRVRHDAIEYAWRSVPDEKRHNWVRMRSRELDTETFRPLGFPYMLQVEPTNACDLRCPLCPIGSGELGRPTRHLKIEEFRSLVEDMERYLLLLVLWDWGEPLLNPALPAMVRYAAERDIKTVTSTNGNFSCGEEYLAELLGSGLSTLIIAVDSVSPESYEVYRKRGSVKRVLGSVERAITLKRKLRSHTRIVVRAVVMKQNEHEIASTREYARRAGADNFVVKTLNPACGATSLDSELVPNTPRYQRFAYLPGTTHRIPAERPCARVFRMANVYSDGAVVPCCYDFSGGMTLGNIRERRFTEIWTSDAYRELRRRVFTAPDSLVRCCQCAESFTLSDTGMFAESHQFRRQPDDGLMQSLRARLLSPQALRLARRAARKLGVPIVRR